MLEDLLHEASDGGLEVCLAETPRPHEAASWEAVREEYELRYRRAVATVRELRGEPTFAGGPHAPGRPLWHHHADHATCWSDEAGLIYVSLCCEADTLRVMGGARPHPVE